MFKSDGKMAVFDVSKSSAICEHVETGDTFRTTNQLWIRLDRVSAPEPETTAGCIYKKTLEELILKETIVYKLVGTSTNIAIADVWVGDIWVNDYMRNMVFR